MPTYGLGTWNDLTVEDIRTAIDLGVTHIGAEVFEGVNKEPLIREAIKGYDRSRFFLSSKTWDGIDYNSTLVACEESLKRLGTDYLDLYILYQYNNIKECLRALNRLKSEGKIRAIGLNNFRVPQIKDAQQYSKIDCVQTRYSQSYRLPETNGVLKYCQDNDIMLEAWRPRMNEGKGAIKWLVSQKNVVVICKTKNKEHLLENLNESIIPVRIS